MNLEQSKEIAIEKDDFDSASIITAEIYKLKSMISEEHFAQDKS